MSDLSEIADRMVHAATEFMAELEPEQRHKATQSFEDEKERRSWFYTPTPRPGLYMREMAPKQQQNVMKLLAAGLSEEGYNHTCAVMGLERLVDYTSNFPDRPYGEIPGTRVRDPGNYCVAVFGEPGDEAGWSWRIGGHHVSLHYTVKDGRVVPTPAFYGAEPAHVKMPGGVLSRALAAEEDLARDLVKLLKPDQAKQAVLSPIAPTDIVQRNNPRIEDGALPQIGGAGPGGQGLRDKLGLTPENDEMYRYSLKPKGLPVKAMDPDQRFLLDRLVRTYFEHMPEPIVAQYTYLLEPDHFDATAFAWAGPAEFGAPHYYRVQGERLLIEYDCTQNDANHTHSVWRDPQGDFGDDVLRQHYAADHA